MTFVARQINVSFTLGSGNFQANGTSGGNASSAGNTASAGSAGPPALNLRISCRIQSMGGIAGSTASVAIWGLPLSLMNQLSVIGANFAQMNSKNSISIMAGDAQSGMPLVFKGPIISAFVEASAQPQVSFRVEASPGAALNAMKNAPTSVKGKADGVQLFQQICNQAGLKFQNYGVSNKTLRNPYLWGSFGNQIRQLARACGVEHSIDKDTLTISPAGKGGGETITISPQTGLVGYPSFNQSFMILRTVFNASFNLQQKIQVQSSLTPACGQWTISRIDHEIDANMPRGKWFTTLNCIPEIAGSGGDTPSG